VDLHQVQKGVADDEGERYLSVAQNPDSRLIASKHIGGREEEDWKSLLEDLDLRLDRSYPLPLFVSDEWDAIKEAIEEVYGIETLPTHEGRGRPSTRSQFVVRPDLKYAQIIRHRDVHRRLQSVEKRIIHGDEADIRASLILSGCDSISTYRAERQNLSIRNYGKRFARKTICFSKDEDYLASFVEIFQAWFNFVKLHRSLRVRNQDGSYKHRTPAMAQGLVDRRLNWEEILRWRRD